MPDSNNKEMYIIDKAIEITDALGTPIFDDTLSNESIIGKSLTIDSLTINCLYNEQGISVYGYSNGIMVLNTSKILNEYTFIHGTWMKLINDIHNKLHDLVVIDNIQNVIKDLNELKDCYYWYLNTHPIYRHLLDDKLADVGIRINEKIVQSTIISTEGEYPVYNQQNIYYVETDDGVVAMFMPDESTSIDFIKQFKPGKWVKDFKEAFNKYLHIEDYKVRNKLK